MTQTYQRAESRAMRGERVAYRLAREIRDIPRDRNDRGDCEICGRTVLPVSVIHIRPAICTCSNEARPTMADPCREWEVPGICDDCMDAYENPGYYQGQRVEATTSNGDIAKGIIVGFLVQFPDTEGVHSALRGRRAPWDAAELRAVCRDTAACDHDPRAIHVDH